MISASRKTMLAAGALLGAQVGAALAQAPDRSAAAGLALQRACSADHGRLWGVDLCGPLLVVDPQTRRAWASQRVDTFTPQAGGWVGELPPGIGIANTSLSWAGVQWVMVAGPLPRDDEALTILVVHEAWHRIQDRLALPAASPTCAHLETEAGRTLLRLELRALRSAMTHTGAARWQAARDALRFRAARLRQFPDAGAEEDSLDRNEGLAEYTGVTLGARTPNAHAAARLAASDESDGFARSYAYITGPAYGLLLDERSNRWRRNLGARAPAEILAGMLGVRDVDDDALRAAAVRYEGGAVAEQERQRALRQVARIADLRARFVDGPRLILPLSASQRMEFDPNHVLPVADIGTIYATLTVRDAWGEFHATRDALMAGDFSRAVLAAPNADGLSGPGWSLVLAQGFHVGPPDADGARIVARN